MMVGGGVIEEFDLIEGLSGSFREENICGSGNSHVCIPPPRLFFPMHDVAIIAHGVFLIANHLKCDVGSYVNLLAIFFC